MISQGLKVVPPTAQDRALNDFSQVIQRKFDQLYGAGHVHIGQQGVLTAFPAKNDGEVGDIFIVVSSGSAYLCFKTGDTTWFRLGPATAI